MGLVQAKIETAIETSPQLIESLHMARQVALKTKVSQVLPEHLQLAMLEDDESSFLLEAYGVDFKKIRVQLAKQAKKYSQPGTPGQKAVFSPQIETIMQHAREQAQKNALGEVDSNLVLAVMLSEEGGFLLKQLTPYDLDSSGVLQYLELREGKTVTITPLPKLKDIIPAATLAPTPAIPTAQKKPTQTPSPLPPPTVAPATIAPPAPPPVAPAPPAAAPAPDAKAPPSTIEPAASLTAASAATPTVSRVPPDTAPELAQAQSTPPAQSQQTSPQQKMPPAAALPVPLAPEMPQMPKPPKSAPVSPVVAQAPLSAKDLTQPAAYGESIAPAPLMPPAPAPAPAPAPPPPHNITAPQTKAPLPDSPSSNEPSDQVPAPSKKRSLFGGFGRKKKVKDSQGSQTEQTFLSPVNEPSRDAAPMQALPLPSAITPPPVQQALQAQSTPEVQSPPQTQPTSEAQPVPQAANNNPAPAPHTNLFAAPAPTPQSVDALLDRPPVPEQPQTIEALHTAAHMRNRPAKRRRASPDSLGANESLSATGSVLEKGRLVENIPRRMKVNVACRAEVRITRAQMDEINNEFADLSSSHIHELAVTEAMTVQLRAPGGGFHIENLSPQTQWIDRNQRHIDDADFGAWKWNVTPTKSGQSRLQLVISARTVDDEGNIHIADIPDKIIALGIARDHRSLAKKTGIVSLVGVAGLVLGKYGETAWHWFSQLTNMTG